MISRRPEGRREFDLRPCVIEPGVNRYAEGSVLIKCGNTHVLCTATIEDQVPGWMKNTGKGWITAEYSMLPRSTHTRSKRDREKVSGRTQEIQRLIGRALRQMVDLGALGERQIIVDCDVLQADGGTRTASITGACVALGIALWNGHRLGKFPLSVWRETVSAVSLGIHDGEVLVDLDYEEDSTCEVDCNFVMTGKKREFVEIQGTGEKSTFSADEMVKMLGIAQTALVELRNKQYAVFEAMNIRYPAELLR